MHGLFIENLTASSVPKSGNCARETSGCVKGNRTWQLWRRQETKSRDDNDKRVSEKDYAIRAEKTNGFFSPQCVSHSSDIKLGIIFG